MEKIKSKSQIDKELRERIRYSPTPRPCHYCYQPGHYGLVQSKNSGMIPLNARLYCPNCLNQYIAYKTDCIYLKALLANKSSVENAIDDLERAGLQMSDPRVVEIIRSISQAVETGAEHYESKAEVKTAIILRLNNIDFTAADKYSINNQSFPIDFRLPAQKVILEIDGELHGLRDTGNAVLRDINITKEEGEGWEVVRIPTSIVDNHPFRIPELIHLGRNYLQDLRQKNSFGLLPPRYLEKLQKEYEKYLNPEQIQQRGLPEIIY